MLLNGGSRIRNISLGNVLIISLAILCFLYSLYIAIKYANQVPLDQYSFRQTQTALTAYWFVKNGFSFAYETPVAGLPWSIPFEFPIYQYAVALASQITNTSLDASGRIVSFLFLALCVAPARSITKKLNLSPQVFYIFVALLFSSPLYLYWGRTFMIETAAVFFSIAAIKYFIDIILEKSSLKNSFLFLCFISFSILQKATTGLPVLALLSFVYIGLNIKEVNSLKIFLFSKRALLTLAYFGIPLAIGIIWTVYTDQIKALNGLGVNLTSGALSKWNWGTLNQRLSFDLYGNVIWERIFERNLSGLLGAALLILAFFSNAKKSIKVIVAISTLLGLVPVFLFANLHIVHTYYQTGNVIFFIYAIAVVLGHVLNSYFEDKKGLYAITILMVASNYFWFSKEYIDIIKTEYTKENSRDYAISEVLKQEIPEGKYFVAFGNDWNSSFPYLAERKSFTVPTFFKHYEEIALNPEHFIKETQLGGVVVCPLEGQPTLENLSQWSSNNRRWKIGQVHSCYLAFPETILDHSLASSSKQCQGNIDFATESKIGSNKFLSVAGWTAISAEKALMPEKVYVTLTKKNSEPLYFEALQVNRPDINADFRLSNAIDIGFSRLISSNSLTGKYIVGITRLNLGHLEVCQFQKEISID